jgi:hypothetical protein
MANEYPNTGIMSRNDKKREGTKDPDFSGSLDILCEHCGKSFTRKLGAWVMEARTGRKFFSLSFKPAQNNGQTGQQLAGRAQFNKRVQEMGTDIDEAPPDDDVDRAFAAQPQRRPNVQDLARGIPLDDEGGF